MAKASVTEFSGLVRDVGGGVAQCLDWAAMTARQSVSFTTTAQSAAFNDDTAIIRIAADADCWYLVGSNPTATADISTTAASVFLAKGAVDTIGVESGEKIAFYDGST